MVVATVSLITKARISDSYYSNFDIYHPWRGVYFVTSFNLLLMIFLVGASFYQIKLFPDAL